MPGRCNLRDFHHSEFLSESEAQGGSDSDLDHRLLMPDGSIKYIYNLSHSLRDEAGNEKLSAP